MQSLQILGMSEVNFSHLNIFCLTTDFANCNDGRYITLYIDPSGKLGFILNNSD